MAAKTEGRKKLRNQRYSRNERLYNAEQWDRAGKTCELSSACLVQPNLDPVSFIMSQKRS